LDYLTSETFARLNSYVRSSFFLLNCIPQMHSHPSQKTGTYAQNGFSGGGSNLGRTACFLQFHGYWLDLCKLMKKFGRIISLHVLQLVCCICYDNIGRFIFRLLTGTKTEMCTCWVDPKVGWGGIENYRNLFLDAGKFMCCDQTSNSLTFFKFYHPRGGVV